LAVGPILAVTAAYAIECHRGLGPSLAALGLVSTVLSVAVISASLFAWEPEWAGARGAALLREWRAEFAPRRLVGCFGVCLAVFGYAMLWRFTYPNIDGSSEKIADFSYICSYYTGTTIPVPDVWFHPYPSTQYYSFQHYGAALMGRVLLLPPGSAYNLGYCLLIALGGTAFAGAVCMVARKAWTRTAVVACFVIGGTGITLLDHLTDKNVTPWTVMRFIGSAQMDKPPVGTWLREYQDKFKIVEMSGNSFPMELPGEIYSYVVFLGDYHAPLSGYYLLGLAAMAMLLWARTRQRRYPVIAGCTLTWTLLANTWVLPLQGLAIFMWLAVNWRDWRRLVPAVAGGAAAVWLAAWVYLSAFTAAASGYGTAVRMVPWIEHTPPLLFVLFFLPTIAFIVLGFASGTSQGRRLAVLWLALLLFTEFFFVDDEYSGHYDRFNTTLKWWPWVMAGTLMTLAPYVLEQAKRRWVRVAGLIFCLYPCCYVYDLWEPMWNGPKDSVGKIEGHFYLTKDEFPRLMLGRLKVEKPGVVIERPDEQGGFVNSAVIPLFAGQKMWLGWWGHELLWRENREDVRRRHDRLMLFYGGGIPDAGKWLVAQGIDYVLWYRPGDTPELWEKVNKAVSPEYIWCDILTYQNEDGRRVGLWKRAAEAPP
ncbi:MAG TPA: DUF2298 domain-containing protein, partial [Opitutaceae bacterium]|nr:DUF2298 domain-containing protein [Opitutaceae bacterium]